MAEATILDALNAIYDKLPLVSPVAANLVAAGPTSGSSAIPTYRSLVSADLPTSPTISGTTTVAQLIDSGLTASTVPYANSSKQLTSSAVTPTELGYLSGATSNIQTQINSLTLPALASAHIFVGNGSNVATDVAVSGDLTLANTGAFTVATVAASSAANVHAAELLANAATSANTAGAIVKRGSSGEFSCGAVTSNGQLTVTGTTFGVPQTVVGYDGTNKLSTLVNSAGGTTITAAGSGPFFNLVGGSLGINATSPGYTLDVNNGAVNTTGIRTFGSADNTYITLLNQGTGGRNYTIASASGSSGWGSGNFAILDLTANALRLAMDSSGNIGIGAITAPSAQLHTNGTVRFANFGAGAATFDASGNISSASDSRLKKNIAEYFAGLEAVNKLRPVSFQWNEKSELEQKGRYAGFIAQEVETVLPHSTGTDSRGYKSLQDRAILAAAVKAIQELSAQNVELRSRINELEQRGRV